VDIGQAVEMIRRVELIDPLRASVLLFGDIRGPPPETAASSPSAATRPVEGFTLAGKGAMGTTLSVSKGPTIE